MDLVADLSRKLLHQLEGPIAIAPGIYTDIPHEDYRRWDAISNSELGRLRASPMHLHHSMTHPKDEPTDAMIIGSAVHCSLLEPDRFLASYIQGPAGKWTLKANRDRAEELRALHPGAIVMHGEDYENVLSARDAVLSHPTAGPLLEKANATEVSLRWDASPLASAQPVRCKGRPDALRPDLGAILDIKKTGRLAVREVFSRSLVEMGYIRQASFYLDGINTVSPVRYEHFCFIVVEEEPPHGIMCYELDPLNIEAGRRQYMRLLRTYAICRESDEWPGYDDRITYISAPDWALDQLED